jgi:hypothetical protein
MVMFLGFMAAVTLVMWLVPESPAARALNEQLVEKPLASLSQMKSHHLIFFILMAGFALGGGEIFLLMGPEVATAFIVDLSIYFDAVLVTYALSALATARKGLSFLTLPITSRLRRFRSRRKRTAVVKPDRRPSNDDEPHPAFVALAV